MSLAAVTRDVWIAEGEIVDFHGFAYPTRSVVVRLPDGALWVWSPVALTPALEEAITSLGQPQHLVSPNKIHHLYLQDWQARWPRARLWGPETTHRKRRDLAFAPALDDTAPDDWQDVIDLVRVRGSVFMDEVEFFHEPSRTLILADLSENFSPDFIARHWAGWKGRIASLWGIVEGRGYAPLEWRWSFLRRAPLRAAKRRMLAWQPERVIMAHGTWQGENGTAYLERALAWV